MPIGLILSSVTLAAIAQLTLKMGMNHVTDANGGQLALSGESLKQILTTSRSGSGSASSGSRPWSGCSCCRARRSRSPIRSRRSATCIILLADSILFLDEHVPPLLRWAGVACIVAGILLVAQGSPHG